jgi:hypothetical protein
VEVISLQRMFTTTVFYDLLRALPDLFGIVFYPPGLRVDLLMLTLGESDDVTVMIEDNKSGAGGALIDGCYVAHFASC